MSDLIERMAKAAYTKNLELYAADLLTIPVERRPPIISWDDEVEPLRANWRQYIRAALTEARGFGQQIQNASTHDDDVYLGGHLDAHSFATVWEAGIDKALES